ncbi:MAG: ABC transporter ATP-binding protein [Thermotoga caldifontis]|uniref:ABC transporter ATP-binding protein n=1 Tax=Thermotoga caldifontis TaxID=1508419 RepID=UPI003C7EA05D
MLLKVENLKIGFKTNMGKIVPVDDVSFELSEGETLGIVGESGCGKTVTAYAITRLLPRNAFVGEESHIWFNGVDLLKLPKQELYRIRGKEISMIFQEPMTSLNPVYTIGWQLSEVYELHERLQKEETTGRVIKMLKDVKIPEPESRIKHYPYQLSGGMRQRVMIAMALACNPKLLIADEPTTALDVTIQAQILKLMLELKEKYRTAVMLITHNLAVVAEVCDRVVVMYAGQVIETADVFELFENPLHPYTKALLSSVPRIDWQERRRLASIEGTVPHPARYPKGCRFHPRCSLKMDICSEKEPDRVEVKANHLVKCWLYAGGDREWKNS